MADHEQPKGFKTLIGCAVVFWIVVISIPVTLSIRNGMENAARERQEAQEKAETERRRLAVEQAYARAAQARRAFEESAIAVCEGAPWNGAPAYARTTGRHSLRTVGQFQHGEWAVQWPADMDERSPDVTPPELVVCRSRMRVRNLSRCGPYYGEGREHYVERRVFQTRFDMRAAATGQLVDSLVIEDQILPRCQRAYVFFQGGGPPRSEESHGSGETHDRSTAWIASHTEIP